MKRHAHVSVVALIYSNKVEVASTNMVQAEMVRFKKRLDIMRGPVVKPAGHSTLNHLLTISKNLIRRLDSLASFFGFKLLP